MNVKILYDNRERYGFEYGWGFSALVDDRIMFDMGSSDRALRANCEAFGVDLDAVTTVVLSHGDWDHIGGVGLLRRMRGVREVYLPEACRLALRDTIRHLRPEARVIPVTDTVQTPEGATVTRQQGWRKKEISLVVPGDDGCVVLTGCAHPGLGRILKEARLVGQVQALVGGFHGLRRLSSLAGIPVIVAAHCTRRTSSILARYPMQAREAASGMELAL